MDHSKLCLNELRSRLSDVQREILGEMWRYWCDASKIITAIALYNKFGKLEVESSLEELGGSIAYRSGNPDTGRSYYQLTFLGIMLSDYGKEFQKVLEKYLSYLHDRLESEPELTIITEDNLRYGALLSKSDRDALKKIITQSPFWNGDNALELMLRVPRSVDALAMASDIHEFFEEVALKDYDPNKPIDWSLTNSYPTSIPVKTEDEPRYDVFLSYASADQAEADEIFEGIRNAKGEIFLAAKSLKAGDDFAEEIRRALHGSREVWLLLSPNSLKSEWVISEWGAAWALKKRIVPILLRCAPADIPERIRRLHFVDFHKYKDLFKGGFSKERSTSAKNSRALRGQLEGLEDPRGKSVRQTAPTCPNCSTRTPVFMSPIPEDFIELENATHECPQCQFKMRS